MKHFCTYLILVFCLFLSGNMMAQTFTSFTTADGLPDNFINGGVAVDQSNNIWIGTANGVAMYNGITWTSYHVGDGIADEYINCIAVDGNDDVWIGTDVGVSVYDGTNWTTYTTVDGLVENAVNSIAGDIDGSVWFGTTSGVSNFNGTIWTTYNTAGGFPTDLITTIHIDAAGNKWFGTWENGVIKYDGSIYTQIDTLDGMQSQYISCIAVDNSGNMLAGTLYGISRFNSSLVWTDSISQATGIYNNYIMDIDIASDGTIWISMFVDYLLDGGVSWSNGGPWVSYNTVNGIADHLVKKMAIDNTGSVWVSTGAGITKISDYTGTAAILSGTIPLFYPNPTSGILNFNQGYSSVYVYDMTGRLVFNADNAAFADLSELPAGYYSVSLTNENGKTSREKLCITTDVTQKDSE